MAIDKIKVNSLGTTGTASSTTFLRGDMSWQANAGGDVVGPGSSTDDALAKFDSTTGKIIQNSTATLSDAGTLTATAFAGPITGNLTGAIQTAAQTNITSLANSVVISTSGAITTTGAFTSVSIDDNGDAKNVNIDATEMWQWSTNGVFNAQVNAGTGGDKPWVFCHDDATSVVANNENMLVVSNGNDTTFMG